MSKIKLYISALFISINVSFAQSIEDNHDFVRTIYQEASDYYEKGFYQKSSEVYDKAIPICIETKDTICHLIWIGKLASDLFSGEVQSIKTYISHAEMFYKNFYRVEKKLKFYQAKASYEHYMALYDVALSTFNSALHKSFYEGAKYQSVKANLLNSRGNLFIELNEFDKAYEDYRESLSIMLKESVQDKEDIATTYNNIGVVYQYKNDFDSALYYYKIANDFYIDLYGINHPHVARQLYNIGQIYFIKGYLEDAQSNFKKALKIRIQTHGEQHEEVARLYGAIGQIYQEKLDYDQALIFFKKCNSISIKVYGDNHPFTAQSLVDIALILKVQKKYDAALQNYTKAYEIRKQNYSENHLDVARSTFDLAEFFLEIKEPKTALQWAEKTLYIIKKVQGVETSLKVMYAYQLLGDVELALQHYNKARTYYKKALSLFEINFHSNHWKLSEIYRKLGKAYENENLQTAINYYDLACSLASNIHNNKEFNFNKIVHPFLINALSDRAKLYYEMRCWENSLQDLKQIASLLPELRKTLRFDNSKLSLAQNYYKVLALGVDVSWELYKTTNNSDYINEAFTFMEGSKHNVLYEEIMHYNHLMVAGVPQDIISEEKKIKTEWIFMLQEALIEEDGQSDELMFKLKEIEHKWNDFEKKIKNLYPKYYSLMYNTPIPKVEDLQKTLQKNKSLVQYFVGDAEVYAIVINPSNVHFYKLGSKNIIEQSFIEWAKSNQSLDRTKYVKSSFSLYQDIFEPIEQFLFDQIVIIPDDFLYNISFESLVKKSNHSKPEYLIYDYTMLYAASASLYHHQKNKRYKLKSLLAILPDHHNTIENQQYNLPGAQMEVEFLKKLFKVRLLKGKDANNLSLLKNIPHFDILHFATHAQIDEDNPMNSYFQLQDEKFYNYHLYQTQINASLAVLSACNTGIGVISKGEGQLSLGRGFSYAGCDNLIMSLWAISDKTSTFIIKEFYKNMLLKMDKTEALRQAKINYLEANKGYSSLPFYWAGFILQGNNEQIYLFNKRNFFIKMLSFLLLIIGIGLSGYFVYKFKGVYKS